MRRMQCTLHLVLCVIITIMTLIGGGLTPDAATAATYYVATNGTDSNPGTQARPFRTINTGVSILRPGDTLYVRAGTYRESLMDNIPSGNSWTSPVTVAAYLGETVTLKPNPGSGWVLHFQTQQYIVVSGFIMDGTNVTEDVVKITGEGTPATAAHHIRIMNSELTKAPGNGVMISQYAHHNEFINLHIHHNATSDGPVGSGYIHGMYIAGADNLVEGCTIHDSKGYGLHVYSERGKADRNIIRNNVISNEGFGAQSAAILISSGDGNIVYGNILYSNYGSVKIAYNGVSNSKVYNNTIYGNPSYGVQVVDATGSIIQNNILYQNGIDINIISGSSTTQDHNLLGVDPKFVNAAAGDFRIEATSPARDAGFNLISEGITRDFAGVARPQGCCFAIGAYEYQRSGSSPPSPPSGLIVAP